MLIVSLQDVEFGYHDVPCLEDARVEIFSGEFVAVTGRNGAAKTTLLKLMLGLLDPWKGSVRLASRNAEGKRLTIGYVPQQMAAFNGAFPSTVMEFVRSGRHAKGSWLRRLRPEDIRIAEQTIRQVGLWELRHRKIGELSGGQKQKMCIARALAQEPDLLVLDEPVAGMDAESRLGFYRLLHRQVNECGTTVVMVTHSLPEVGNYLSRIIALERKEDGRWKCCTTTSCSGHFVPEGSSLCWLPRWGST